jgi:site-specific DNA-adenine methylase
MPPRCQNPNTPAPDDPGWCHYVEPFAGGLSVLLANDPHGISECVNDLNGDLVNFWRVLQGEKPFAEFCHKVTAIPLCEAEWRQAIDKLRRPCKRPVCVPHALAFFICVRQSLAGRMKGFTALTRNRPVEE